MFLLGGVVEVRTRGGAGVAAGHGGHEVELQGDGFLLAFSSERSALLCAIAIQRAFAAYSEAHPEEPIRVRIGLHTGEVLKDADKFFGKTVIDMLSEYSPDLKDLILHMEVRTPHELEEEVGLTEGNIFQGELTMDQIMFNRPTPGYAQYRMPVKHLYMCGSSTHPGGGVMGAPGANAAREIIADMRAGRKA